LRAAFAAALADDPAERHPSAAEFVASFRDAFSNRDESEPIVQIIGNVATVFDSEEVDEPPPAPAPAPVPVPVLRMTPATEKPAAIELPFRREAAPVRDFEIRQTTREPERRPSRDQIAPVHRTQPPPVPILHSTLRELHEVDAPRRGGLLLLALGIVAGIVVGFTGGFVVGQRSLRLAIAPAATEETTQARAEEQSSSANQSSNSPAAATSEPSAQAAQPIAEPELRAPNPPLSPTAPAGQAPLSPTASAQQAPNPEPGRLLVRSTPSGAGVTIDGATRGVTPLALRELALGEHTIEVAYPGHDTRQQRVTLTAQRPSRSMDIQLRSSAPARSQAVEPASSARTGALQIASRPVGGQVFLDDNLVGTTPLLLPDVSTGTHRVRIEMPGFQTFSTTVQVEPGARFRLAASLEQ
jgi:cytoskeletal protein RodZ